MTKKTTKKKKKKRKASKWTFTGFKPAGHDWKGPGGIKGSKKKGKKK